MGLSSLRDKLGEGMGRADRTIAKNVIAAFVIKGGSLVVSLATVPAFMRYFSDNAMLGVWYTLLSVMTWMLSFDFGIGNGLRNRLVGALDQEDKDECKALVSSAYACVAGVCLLFAVVLGVVIPFLDWGGIYGIDASVVDNGTLVFATNCVMIGMVVQLVLKNVNSIYYALQKSAVNNFLSLSVSLLQLVFILVIPRMDSIDALKVMSIGYAVISNLPSLVATFVVFVKDLPYAAPSFRCVTSQATRAVFGLGIAFFLAQILYMVIANTNEIFISSFFAAEYVVQYQVYYKIYSLVGMLMSLALTPVWSAVTKAAIEGDQVWLRKLFRRLELFGLVVAAGELVLVPFTQFLFNIWLGDKSFEASMGFALVFAAFGAVFAYQNVVAVFANGIGDLSTQIKAYSIGVVAKVVCIVLAASAGLPWIFVIVGDIVALVPFCLMQRRKVVGMLAELN